MCQNRQFLRCLKPGDTRCMSNTPRDPLLSRLEIEGFADLLLVGVCISKQISRLYGVLDNL